MNAPCPHSLGEVILKGDQCHLPELLGRLDPSCPQWSGACEHNCSPLHLMSPLPLYPSPQKDGSGTFCLILVIHEDRNQP